MLNARLAVRKGERKDQRLENEFVDVFRSHISSLLKSPLKTFYYLVDIKYVNLYFIISVCCSF